MRVKSMIATVVIVAVVIKLMSFWLCTKLDIVWQDYSTSISKSDSIGALIRKYDLGADSIVQKIKAKHNIELGTLFVERNYDPKCSLFGFNQRYEFLENYTVVLPMIATDRNDYEKILIQLTSLADSVRINGNTTLSTVWVGRVKNSNLSGRKLVVTTQDGNNRYELTLKE